MELFTQACRENAKKLFKFLGACDYEDDKVNDRRNALTLLNFNEIKEQNFNIQKQKENIEEMPIQLKKGGIRFNSTKNLYEVRLQINGIRKSFYSISKAECIKKANTFYTKTLKSIKLQNKTTNNNSLQNVLIDYENKNIETQSYKSMQFYKWLDIWLEEYKKNIKKNSLRELRSNIEQHLKPIFEDKQLNRIKAIDVDMALNKMKNSRTKETTYSIFYNSLKTAYNKDFLDKPIHERIEKIKYIRGQGRCLNEDERIIFLNAIEKLPYRNLFKFIYLTGVRKHGALNLNKDNINFQNETIEIKETKSKNGYRILPFFNGVKEILEEQINLNVDSEKVFQVTDRQLKNNLNELEKLCGFRVRLKDLRTTFATRCIEKKISDSLIIKWMGHANISTTKKYYIKTTEQYEKEQSKLL